MFLTSDTDLRGSDFNIRKLDKVVSVLNNDIL